MGKTLSKCSLSSPVIEGLTFDLCVGDLEFEDLELDLDDPDVGLRGELGCMCSKICSFAKLWCHVLSVQCCIVKSKQ